MNARPPSTVRRLSNTLRSLGGAFFGILPLGRAGRGPEDADPKAAPAVRIDLEGDGDGDAGSSGSSSGGHGQPYAGGGSSATSAGSSGSSSAGTGNVLWTVTPSSGGGRAEGALITRAPLPRFAQLSEFVRCDDNRAMQRRVLWRLHCLHELDQPSTMRRYRLTEKQYRARKAILKEYDGSKNQFAVSRLSQISSFFNRRRGSWAKGQPATADEGRGPAPAADGVHLLRLAVRDNRLETAMENAASIAVDRLVETDPTAASDVLARAMINRMEELVLFLLARKYPPDVNVPIFALQLRPAHEGAITTAIYCPSALMLAITFELEELTMLMIKAHARLRASWYGMTPLALAAGMHGRGNARIVNILLECGADPMQGVPLDKCKLMWQLRRQVAPDLRGSFVLPSELVQPESKRQLGPAPILRPGSARPPAPPPRIQPAASALAPIPAATTPVSVGPNSSSASGSSAPQPARRALYPLDFAAAAGNRDAVALLLQRLSAEQVARCRYCLVLSGDAFITAQLLDSGADVRCTAQRGSTALHLAARRGNIDAMTLLIHFGAQVNARGQNGWTPLHEAVGRNSLECVERLLEYGANPTVRSAMGETPHALFKRIGYAHDPEIGTVLEAATTVRTPPSSLPENVAQLLAAARSYRPPQRRETAQRRGSFLGRRRANTADSSTGGGGATASSDSSPTGSLGTSPEPKESGLRGRRMSWGRSPLVDVGAASSSAPTPSLLQVPGSPPPLSSSPQPRTPIPDRGNARNRRKSSLNPNSQPPT